MVRVLHNPIIKLHRRKTIQVPAMQLLKCSIQWPKKTHDQAFNKWLILSYHMVRTNIFTIECLSLFMNHGAHTLFRNHKVLSQMTGKMFWCSMPLHCRVCNTFIKPRSDHCLARVSMICLMLLKAWLIGLWLLIISPGKSCWCSIDIISAFAESAILLSNPGPVIALPMCPWCARCFWRLDL